MADYKSRNVNTSFSGLVTTAAIFAVTGTVCLLGFETMRQLRRLPNVKFIPFWKNDRKSREAGGGVDVKGIGAREKMTCEDWEMGHLYQARMFHAATPTPPMARWPLAWSWQALKFDDWFYATHTGMDTVVYVRFLRACVWWTLLQTLTTAPILLALHFKFSHDIPLTDMSRASLSWLVTTPEITEECKDDLPKCKRLPNEDGRALLWVHLCLIWWISFTWLYAVWWIGKGSLLVRRRLIGELRKKRALEREQSGTTGRAIMPGPNQSTALDGDREAGALGKSVSEAQGLKVPTDDSEGWRQRSLMVMNLPATMRDEASIRRYFEEFLRPDDDASLLSAEDADERRQESDATDGKSMAAMLEAAEAHGQGSSSEDGDYARHTPRAATQAEINAERNLRSPVQTVVLVRKMNELSSMLSRRQDVLSQLEAAHIKLAKNAMKAVGKSTKRLRKGDKAKSGGMGGVGMGKLDQDARRDATDGTVEVHSTPRGSADVEKHAEERRRADDLAKRLARFAPGNLGLHGRDNEEAAGADGSSDDANKMHETVWEALANVPRELLDDHQPVTRLNALFRGQTVPTIDYLLTKLNLLTALVTEMRARPPTSYEPTSTAFVTFRDPRQARMVWRELKTQIVIKVRLAPEVKDLDWERLMRTSFTGDLVRGLGVNTFFWGFTIFWVIPINLLTTGLFSVSKLELVVPGLDDFFKNNPNLKGFVTVTLPTLIVALITMSVPEIIFQISKRAQGFVTFSALYDQCLCRYWKFVVCNVIIFFCVGVTAVQTILRQAGASGQLLDTIAFSFPTAAPFFVSYLILGMALHTGFELLGFMVPLIQHLGARNAATPRGRALKTLPRNFNRYYWLPFHILIMTIIFVFAILNPLVIPFALVYMWVAMIVFKKNFAFTYFRRFNEMEGAVYFVRLLRYSLDGVVLAQAVILIFFSVTKQRAVYIALTALLIPVTVLAKMLGTRLWKSQCRAIEDEEANALCGIGSNTPLTKSGERDWGANEGKEGREETYDTRSPLDARASGRYPAILPKPTNGSALLRYWRRVHDSFNANGQDAPGYAATMQAQHPQHEHSMSGVKFVATAPAKAIKGVADAARHKAASSKAQLEYAKSVNNNAELAEVKASAQALARADPAELLRDSPARRQARAGKKRPQSKRGHSLLRGASTKSTRSDEAPFLSGFEAIANHAPVPGDIGDDSFADGEQEGYYAAMHRSRSSRSRRQGSASHGTTAGMRTVPSDGGWYRDDGAPVGEFGAMRGHLMTPHESEEARNDLDDPLGGVVYAEPKQMPEDGADETDEDAEDDDESEIDDGPLVRPHAKVRWDDTPNNSARYNNPFYSRELDPFLWLPRDPLAPIDLFDTIEWRGAALVSSQGGAGNVGEWEDEEDETLVEQESGDAHSATSRGFVADIDGQEEIIISGPLAQRLQEAEDAEQAVDPAASLPRNVMDDYKRAIRRGASDAGSYDDDRLRPSSPMSIPIRSPSLRARRIQHLGSELEVPDHHPPGHSPRPDRKVTAGTITSLDLGPSSAPQETTFPLSPSSNLPLSPTTAQTSFPLSPPTAVSFQAEPSTGRRPRVISGTEGRLTHPRRGASMRSNGGDSIISGGLTRTVTMRKALQAEVLEEERRRTIRDRVAAAKKNKKKHSKEPRDEEAVEEDPAVTHAMQRSNTIMGRHERAIQRRQGGMSESGSVRPHMSASERRAFSQGDDLESPARPARFALREFSFAHHSPARRPSGGAQGRVAGPRAARPSSSRTEDPAQQVPMQELGLGLAPSQRDVARISAPPPGSETAGGLLEPPGKLSTRRGSH